MTSFDHIGAFLDINAAARVHLLCRSQGIWDPRRIGCYTRALKEAVLTLLQESDLSVGAADRLLNEQLALLAIALSNAPPPVLSAPRLPPRDAGLPAEGPTAARPRRTRRIQEAIVPVQAMAMEDKLEAARKPLRQLLQVDCIRLGLLEPLRAQHLAAHLAGKSRRDAEAEVLVEIRNNLHYQITQFIRKHRGGPWETTTAQNEIGLEIAATNSVLEVIALTRQLLAECKEWEAKLKKGLIHNLLRGRLRLAPGPKG